MAKHPELHMIRLQGKISWTLLSWDGSYGTFIRVMVIVGVMTVVTGFRGHVLTIEGLYRLSTMSPGAMLCSLS